MAAPQTGKINEVLKPDTGFIKDLISEGRGKGFITLDDINNHLGDDPPSAEQLEQIFNIFAEMGCDNYVLYFYGTHGKFKTGKFNRLPFQANSSNG